METAYIALGSNLPRLAGNPRQTLDAAIEKLADVGSVLRRPSYYETEPVGYADRPAFWNAAVALGTEFEPEALLEQLLAIEGFFGRDRTHGIPTVRAPWILTCFSTEIEFRRRIDCNCRIPGWPNAALCFSRWRRSLLG